VEMPVGKVLHESGIRLSHVYFPTTSIVSMLCLMESGASSEVAVIGAEGIVGLRCSWAMVRRRTGPSCRAPAKDSG
jgi:hypothetical protein